MSEKELGKPLDEYLSSISLHGEVWHLTRVGDEFCLKAGERFADGMTDPTKLSGGRTVAQVRREELHTLLDEWIDAESSGARAMSDEQ